MLDTAIASEPAAPAGNAEPVASPTPQGTGDGVQPAPATPEPQPGEIAPALRESPTAKLQSQLDRTTNELNTIKAERDTLRSEIEGAKNDLKLEADAAVEQFSRSFEDWLIRAVKDGYSGQQIADHLTNRRKTTTAARDQIERRQQALDGVYSLAESFDPGFAAFLKKLGSDANITHENLTAWKKRYEELGGKAAAPVAAATAITAPKIDDAPPAVPGPSGAAMPDAPAWTPGKTSRALWREAGEALASSARKLTGAERIASTR